MKLKSEIIDNLGELNRRTELLIKKDETIKVLNQLDIEHIYSNRSKAEEDIRRDIQNSKTKTTYLIGISLRDFFGTDNHIFDIKEYIKNYEQKSVGTLNIKILIIDPNCYGARMRAVGEGKGGTSPLKRQLEEEIDDLVKLQCENREKIKFEVRLYRLPPQLFMVSTDKVSYIEPYYFWESLRKTHLPLMRFRYDSDLHNGMVAHFNMIWEYASIDVVEYKEQHSIGIDEGISISGVINNFKDHGTARKRLEWHLSHAKNHVYLQGITLKAFFSPRTDGNSENTLYTALKRLIERGNVEVKVLLLNPWSKQAHYRSYREYLLNNENRKGKLDFKDYEDTLLTDDGLLERTKLFTDAINTRNTIKQLQTGNHPKLFAKWYESAPTCFIFHVDDIVMVQQYHFGDINAVRQQRDLRILGEDATLVEYRKNIQHNRLFKNDDERLVDMVSLMEDHFERVFDNFSTENPEFYNHKKVK